MEQIPFVDRAGEMARLHAAMDDLSARKGRLLLLRGETGIGKSRLVEESMRLASEKGFGVAHGSSLTETMTLYFPWHEALRPLGLEHVLQEVAPPTLCGLYLLTEAGLLVCKEERVSTTADAEIFSGMVTAVTEFMTDALSRVGSTEGPVAAMRSGSRGIVLRRGKGFGIAAVVEGRESEALLDDLRALADRIEEHHGVELRSWTGSSQCLEETGALLRELVGSIKYEGAGTAVADDAESHRALLFGNVVLGLQRNAEAKPLLLVFEDLQWSDPSSLALLHYVARNTRKQPLLILCNYRIEESGVRPHLSEALGKLRAEGLVEEIEVPRLGPADARALVEGLLGKNELPAEFFDLVEQKAAGNPLFIREVIRALEQEGAITSEHGVKKLGRPIERLTVPVHVRDVVAGRLHHLTEEERQVLEAAAVAGTLFKGSLVATMMGEPEVKALRTLGGIGRRYGLVRAEGDRLRFDHPLVREVLYDETLPDLRKAYHLAAADALEKTGAHVIEIAEHLLAAKDPRAAAKLKEAAAVAVAGSAHDEAARIFAQAIGVAPKSELGELWERRGDAYEAGARYQQALEAFTKAGEMDPSRVARCTRKRAATLERFSRYDAALDTVDRALASADATEAAYCLILKALILMRQGKYDEASATSERALFSAVAEQDQAVGAAAMLNMAQCLLGQGDYEHALRRFRQALAAREQTGDRRGIATALNGIGLVHQALGAFREALEAHHKALSIREAIADRYGVAISLNNIGTVHQTLGDLDRALDNFRRCLEIEKSIGDRSGVAMALDNIGNVLGEKGDYETALAHHRDSLATREEIGDRPGMLTSLNNMGGIHHSRGEFAEAKRLCERCLEISLEIGDQSSVAMGNHNLGTVLLEMGDKAGALARLEEALALRESLGEKPSVASSLLSIARVKHAAGDTEGALTGVDRAIRMLDEMGDRFGRIEPLSLLARMQIRLGRTEEARKAADEAVALARESGEKSPLAGAILAQALCETRSGQVEEARKAYSEALTLFEGMGSLADVAQARLDWGLAERQFGNEEKAISNLAVAADTFARCGLAERAAEAREASKSAPRGEPSPSAR